MNWVDDWMDRFHESFRRWTRNLFLYGGLAFYVVAVVVWWCVTGDPFLKSVYWITQSGTTVGYGTGWNDFTVLQQWMCIITMLVMGTYWACLLSLLSSHIAEWFE